MSSPYTNQEVNWAAHDPQDEFGDTAYSKFKRIKARKEPHEELVKTAEGKELLSKHYFYVAPPDGLEIENGDKLDGELIVSKYIMCKLNNKPKMVRFITV